jgi:type IV secretory pathway protease TraF
MGRISKSINSFRKIKIGSLAAFVLLLAVGTQAPKMFTVKKTASVQGTLFLRTFGLLPIHDGDYVIIQYSDNVVGEEQLIKHACISVVRFKKNLYCGGHLVAEGRTSTRPNVLPEGTEIQIPQSAIFLYGTHPKSYDSRNFGLLKRDDAERVVRLI